MRRNTGYDVVVVGAGPAGLSAARTAARLGFRTLVLERLAGPGLLGHPCSGVIGPLPRQAFVNPSGDLYFRKLDLRVPAALVMGYALRQTWVGPGGAAYQTSLSGHPQGPVAILDKPSFMEMLADEARRAGAEIRFGAEVSGLVQQDGSITGVHTGDGEITAQMVLSAEGATRAICQTVLPYRRIAGSERYGLIAAQELAAPAVSDEQVGQVITLGRRYTSARNAFGMLTAPAPGRLSVFFCLFADRPHQFTERSARFYLREYMADDPRVRGLCRDARPLGESVSHFVAGSAPVKITARGFMGLGDAITPTGYLGILPAFSLGRQAALAAAAAIEAADPSPARLAVYEQLFQKRMLPRLITEYRILSGIGDLPEAEMDAFCQSLGRHRSALPFSTHARAIEWSTVGSGYPALRPLVSRPPIPAPDLASPVLA